MAAEADLPGRNQHKNRSGEPAPLHPRGHVGCVKTQVGNIIRYMTVCKSNIVAMRNFTTHGGTTPGQDGILDAHLSALLLNRFGDVVR
jgi:hypothetical protein